MKRRGFIVLLALSNLPFFVKMGELYIRTRLGSFEQISSMGMTEVTPYFFHNFLSVATLPAVIISVVAGASLICSDKQAGALQIYFSRPVNRYDYLFGKLGVLSLFIAVVTLIPALILFIMAIFLQPGGGFFGENYWLLFSIIFYYIVLSLTLGSTMLAFSSLIDRTRFVAMSWVAFFMGTAAIGDIFDTYGPSQYLALVSIDAIRARILDALFKEPSDYVMNPVVSVLVLLAFVSLAGYITMVRAKPVENKG
jgi:ABC-type transport system involved in multi-copper enzyme maturation permease subunit